jgi:hypothetical protein
MLTCVKAPSIDGLLKKNSEFCIVKFKCSNRADYLIELIAMKINSKSLEGALIILGQLLADRGLHYEVVAIGGGSLLLFNSFKTYY